MVTMTIMEAIKERHSVRSYTDKKLSTEIISKLQDEITKSNKESGLHIQLVTNEPKAFNGFMAHYGKFSGVQNYIALIGKKSSKLDETVGYYGEHIALFAQTLGLNTCWVAMTFSKNITKTLCKIQNDEKLVCVLALGYGKTHGIQHKSKAMKDVCKVNGAIPDWFSNGLKAALLAPTATNQQKFMFSLKGKNVSVKATGGFYSKVDLGIVKHHFETGAGKENFTWE